MSIPSERPTKPDMETETEEPPTLKPWEVEAIQELEVQLIRVRSGRACKGCVGSGRVPRPGEYWTTCHKCGGKGMS